jgi:HEAT repeat protein
MIFRSPRALLPLALLLLSNYLCSAQNEGRYDTKQRISRIRQLAKTDAHAIPSLEQYLSDPDVTIRIEAVKAITRIGTESSLSPLIKATTDNDPEVQIRATDGLVNFYLPGFVPKGMLTGPVTRGLRQVKSLLSSRNDQAVGKDIVVRPDVAQALGKEIVHGASIDARSNAARAAGILRAQPAGQALEQALRSKDSELIFEALVAMQKIGDPALGPGVSFLCRDLDDRIQMTALETIGVLRSLDSAPDVRAALNGARNIKIRRAALEALAMLGIPGDRTIFRQYVSSSDVALRVAALEGLGRIRDAGDIPALEAAYNEGDADWRIHLAGAFGLVNNGKVGTADFDPLLYLVENLNQKSHQDTAEAYLTELCRNEDVRKALFPIVGKLDPDQKVALSRAFSASHSEDVVPTLTTLSNDINPQVSVEAARCLKIVQARRL